MLISVIFVILFLLCLLGVMLYPKTESAMNGIKLVIMGLFSILCYQVMSAFVFKAMHISIGIISMSVSLGILAILLWFGIWKKKKLQKLFWRISDFISIFIISAVVIGVSIHIFSGKLYLQYKNIDAAAHFSLAMDIVRNGTIGNIYFSAFIDAMFIELFAPLLTAIQYYKAFIFADIFMHILEVCMFYVLLLTISEKKIVKSLAFILCIGYFFGYPAYSFMTGNFVYWSNGVMILIFIIYALLLLERYIELTKYSGILFVLGVFSNACCNKLFIPLNTAVSFVALLLIIVGRRKTIANKKKLLGITGGVLVTGLVVCIVYFSIWGDTLKNISDTIMGNGGIYRSMYADLIFFLPALFLSFYYNFIKKKQSKIICVMSLCMILCTVMMYILWYNYFLSTYYYYKIYYNLWLFGWLLCVLALSIMAETGQLAGFFSYAGMIVFLCMIVLTNYDYKMWFHNVEYNGSYATKQLFSLYRYNMDSLLEDYEAYRISDLALDVFNYSIENYSGETVPILVSGSEEKMWYDALSGNYSEGYRLDNYDFADTIPLLDTTGIKRILVTKKDENYQTYQEYFENCTLIYGNDAAMILEPAGTAWADVSEIIPNYSTEKIGLFTYVNNSLENENVPLMADKSAYLDYMMYYNLTGRSSKEFYTWYYNPRENIDNLNNHGIKYVILLFEDEYYNENKDYFDSQEVVYENEAGKIIRCIGEKWSTQYK